VGDPLLSRMRFHRLFTLLLATLACVGGGFAYGGDLYAIAHPGLKLSANDIREIYLGDKEFSGEVRLVPVENQAAQAEFVAKALAMDLHRYSMHWVKKSFRDGLNPPAAKSTDLEVLEFVRRTAGAVGYVSSAPLDKDVMVVRKF